MRWSVPGSIAVCLISVIAGTASPAESGWPLEFGPYSGYYDFDRVTQFRDRALFGARVALRPESAWSVEAEFEEVYTRRTSTDNAARQVAFAAHLRYEPLRSAISPSFLAGMAFVGLDDQDDPDSYGEAVDFGAGLRWRVGQGWTLRAEWMLRRQSVLLHRLDGTQEELDLYGRAFRLGAGYAF